MPLTGFFASIAIGMFVAAALSIGFEFHGWHPVLKGMFLLFLPFVIAIPAFRVLVEIDWLLLQRSARIAESKKTANEVGNQ